VAEGERQRIHCGRNQRRQKLFPSGLKDNDDYTSIVNQRHYDRIQGLPEDARAKRRRSDRDQTRQATFFANSRTTKLTPHNHRRTTDGHDVIAGRIFRPDLPIQVLWRNAAMQLPIFNANAPLGRTISVRMQRSAIRS